ncbi:MAG: hypothetical protein AB7E61_05905 [Acholeplasmataceae bacterium]
MAKIAKIFSVIQLVVFVLMVVLSVNVIIQMVVYHDSWGSLVLIIYAIFYFIFSMLSLIPYIMIGKKYGFRNHKLYTYIVLLSILLSIIMFIVGITQS